MLARGILGSGRTRTVSPFDLSRTLPGGGGLLVLNSLTRISCHKTTHANGYCGAWPGWAVSISVLPLTISPSSVFLGGFMSSTEELFYFSYAFTSKAVLA